LVIIAALWVRASIPEFRTSRPMSFFLDKFRRTSYKDFSYSYFIAKL